eukprot:2053159-Rhodomonas_salina.2
MLRGDASDNACPPPDRRARSKPWSLRGLDQGLSRDALDFFGFVRCHSRSAKSVRNDEDESSICCSSRRRSQSFYTPALRRRMGPGCPKVEVKLAVPLVYPMLSP